MTFDFDRQDLDTVVAQCHPQASDPPDAQLLSINWVEGAQVNAAAWGYWNDEEEFRIHYCNTARHWTTMRIQRALDAEDDEWSPTTGAWPDPWDFEANVRAGLLILTSDVGHAHDHASSTLVAEPAPEEEPAGMILDLVVDHTQQIAGVREPTPENPDDSVDMDGDDLPF